MSKNFLNEVQKTLNNKYNYSITENRALGFRTTGKELLDLNFQVASLRGASEVDITNRFMRAFYEDQMLAMKWLFYSRDVRGGLGERRLFRIVVSYLIKNQPEIAEAIIKLIPEYGRFDDLMIYVHTESFNRMLLVIRNQLKQDLMNYANDKPISLLCKWLPSINTSSVDSVGKARIIARALGMDDRTYRKTLSELRAYIKIVEADMSAGRWGAIDYASVPSKANLLYKNAFIKHDKERREDFLQKVEKGEAKINAGVLYPHDIVHQYVEIADIWNMTLKKKDQTLEELWKALPNLIKDDDSTIVVADGSGSMMSRLGGDTSVLAIEVANALAIYFAEKCEGEFKNKYITFSNRPQLVDFSKATTLRDKIQIALMHDEVENTNIKAVFELILKTAINAQMSQRELPKNILIISDMEFDSCGGNRLNSRLFETITQNYAEAGYKIPRLIFWNVNSRTKTIPVIENDLGVALVSGFSVNIVKMVMSNKTDPYEILLETLNSERYNAIEEVLKPII